MLLFYLLCLLTYKHVSIWGDTYIGDAKVDLEEVFWISSFFEELDILRVLVFLLLLCYPR